MRPTEGIERLVTFLVGVGAPPILSSVVSVKTSILDLEAVLKRAWVKLRNANPSLASYVNGRTETNTSGTMRMIPKNGWKRPFCPAANDA